MTSNPFDQLVLGSSAAADDSAVLGVPDLHAALLCEPAPPPPPPSPAGPLHLLFVDDEDGYASTLQTDLANREVDCRLTVIAGAGPALQRLTEEPFDAILLDIAGAGPGELRTCAELDAADPRRPIIALTSDDHVIPALAAMLAGAEDCLIKGHLDGPALMQRVRLAAERHQRWPRPPVTPDDDHLGRAQRLLHANNGWLRVLQVDRSPGYVHLLQKGLPEDLPVRFDDERVTNLNDALQALRLRPFDALLVEPALPDALGVSTLVGLLGYAAGAALLVVTEDASALPAQAAIRTGADDYFLKDQLAYPLLARALLLARARQEVRNGPEPRRSGGHPIHAVAGDRDNDPNLADPRRDQRYTVSRPVLAIPIFPNGRPDDLHRFEGYTLDASPGGLLFQTGLNERPPGTEVVLGVEIRDGTWAFAHMELRRISPGHGGLQMAGRFAPASRDLLRRENLMPSLDPRTYRFATGLPEESLLHWASLGIVEPQVIDHVLVCPQCRAVPTYRRGCRACGSLHVHNSRLIHHYACAHVAEVSDFMHSGALICPKCHASALVVGADYEHLYGPYRCADCHWTDNDLETVGRCWACDLRFPMQQCAEEELIGYHVHRLDPLVLLDAV